MGIRMIKILELSASLDGGGVDKLLYDFCTRILDSNQDIQFDFVVTSEEEGIFEENLRTLGCEIFHVKQMSDDFLGYIKSLRKIMKKGKYDIIHDHMNQASMGSMIAGKIEKIPVRIAHAHTYIINETTRRK